MLAQDHQAVAFQIAKRAGAVERERVCIGVVAANRELARKGTSGTADVGARPEDLHISGEGAAWRLPALARPRQLLALVRRRRGAERKPEPWPRA